MALASIAETEWPILFHTGLLRRSGIFLSNWTFGQRASASFCRVHSRRQVSSVGRGPIDEDPSGCEQPKKRESLGAPWRLIRTSVLSLLQILRRPNGGEDLCLQLTGNDNRIPLRNVLCSRKHFCRLPTLPH